MGGEQRSAPIGLVQVLKRRPRYGQTVICRGATADFIQDHEGTFGRLIHDGSGLDHFHHEGGTPPG